MKKIILLFTFLIATLITNAQCSYTQLPTAASNASAVCNRNSDPTITFTTGQNVCEYYIYAKLVYSKYGGVTMESYARGYPQVCQAIPGVTMQSFSDPVAKTIATWYNGSITIRYEIVSKNNMGFGPKTYTGYIKVN